MSDIKLQQGSDYHGDGKLFFKEDSYREKFPKGYRKIKPYLRMTPQPNK